MEAETLKAAPNAEIAAVATYVVGVDRIGRACLVPNTAGLVTLLVQRVGYLEAELAKRPKPRLRNRGKTTL